MVKSQKESKLQIIILTIIVLLLIVINLIICLKKYMLPKQNEENQIKTTAQSATTKQTQKNEVPQTDEQIKKYLSTLGERDRMQYYCGKYFNYLKKKNYVAAYSLLYSEFKDKYFPTENEYEEYIKKLYPNFYSLEYDDISRQGDIYVLRLKILDLKKGKDEQGDNVQRIVIKENDYNDFVLSFQVKKVD